MPATFVAWPADLTKKSGKNRRFEENHGRRFVAGDDDQMDAASTEKQSTTTGKPFGATTRYGRESG
ncbi:hypothetical protein [Pelagibius sp. Alg239-R121]|uniref:hypothetical protein n=1 Tax=Pelagibius sp. Alg239-R121 TaxID=2993448 RepID=UPI0024A69B74|nr:hypothetical protein [Pelagibius sp. Alg239-R121]